VVLPVFGPKCELLKDLMRKRTKQFQEVITQGYALIVIPGLFELQNYALNLIAIPFKMHI